MLVCEFWSFCFPCHCCMYLLLNWVSVLQVVCNIEHGICTCLLLAQAKISWQSCAIKLTSEKNSVLFFCFSVLRFFVNGSRHFGCCFFMPPGWRIQLLGIVFSCLPVEESILNFLQFPAQDLLCASPLRICLGYRLLQVFMCTERGGSSQPIKDFCVAILIKPFCVFSCVQTSQVRLWNKLLSCSAARDHQWASELQSSVVIIILHLERNWMWAFSGF